MLVVLLFVIMVASAVSWVKLVSNRELHQMEMGNVRRLDETAVAWLEEIERAHAGRPQKTRTRFSR